MKGGQHVFDLFISPRETMKSKIRTSDGKIYELRKAERPKNYNGHDIEDS